MEKSYKLGLIFDNLADELNITEEMLKKAETAYDSLGDYLKSKNDEWDVVVYPQGSFELGTVVKPVNSKEQYDVDLVVLIKSPVFGAKEIRAEVRELLTAYGRYEGMIEDKKPCIRIRYSDSSQFHMDIACAKNCATHDNTIEIARHDGTGLYYYDISNPQGYIDWFKKAMQYETILKEHVVMHSAQTTVEDLRLSRMRNPLQKAIQILKRHRDIYFTNKPNSDKRPASIIITTLCAMAYEDTFGLYEKNNVYLTILNMLEQFPKYLEKNSDGEYWLNNPSNTSENFLNKWNDDQTLVSAFNEWIIKAKKDIVVNPEEFIESDQQNLKKSLSESFGQEIAENTLVNFGKRIGEMADAGELLFEKDGGNITADKTRGTEYNRHTYFGGTYER